MDLSLLLSLSLSHLPSLYVPHIYYRKTLTQYKILYQNMKKLQQSKINDRCEEHKYWSYHLERIR